MSARHDDNDGSDIFWPGYVDATTNLILNLLFLLTILIVAVFMFALELGRSSKLPAAQQPPIVEQQKPPVSASATDAMSENVALKREIKRLNMLLAQRAAQDVQSAGSAQTIEAKFDMPKPLKGIDVTNSYESEVVVRFEKDAVAFTPDEHEQLTELLAPVAASKKAGIYVEVPVGFSEARRMGFYRAMSVRNVLIEMLMPSENIDISVLEGNENPNASVVRVRAY